MNTIAQTTVLDNQPSKVEQQALHERRAFAQVDLKAIEMRGNDVNDFLQRISTNDFSHFSKGEIRPTLFLTEKGRVIDLVYAIHQGDSILLLISAGAEENVIEWLNKFIIMDDVSLRCIDPVPNIFFALTDKKIATNAGSQYQMTAFGLKFSFFLIYSEADKFITAQRANGLTFVSEKNWEEFRISHGIPQYNKELLEKFNPLEVNLSEFISFTKGCYIGQEVVARLETYNKIQRKLCLLSIVGAPDLEERTLISESTNDEAGILTSVCQNADMPEHFIGLAVVRNRYAIEGEKLTVQGGSIKSNVIKIFCKK